MWPLSVETRGFLRGLVLAGWAFLVLFVWNRKKTRHDAVRARLDPGRSQSVGWR